MNLRPSGPKPDALARLRHTPYIYYHNVYYTTHLIIFTIIVVNMASRQGIEPRPRTLEILVLPLHQRELGGSGEIRTHGTFLFVCFQDRCNKPDSATLPYRNTFITHRIVGGHLYNLIGIKMCFYMAGAIGIEPILIESKSIVLPLHNAPTKAFKFLKNIFG